MNLTNIPLLYNNIKESLCQIPFANETDSWISIIFSIATISMLIFGIYLTFKRINKQDEFIEIQTTANSEIEKHNKYSKAMEMFSAAMLLISKKEVNNGIYESNRIGAIYLLESVMKTDNEFCQIVTNYFIPFLKEQISYYRDIIAEEHTPVNKAMSTILILNLILSRNETTANDNKLVIENLDLSGFNFAPFKLSNIEFHNCYFSGISTFVSRLSEGGAPYDYTKFKNVKFESCHFKNIGFSNIIDENIIFDHCTLKDCSFSHSFIISLDSFKVLVGNSTVNFNDAFIMNLKNNNIRCIEILNGYTDKELEEDEKKTFTKKYENYENTLRILKDEYNL